MGNCLALCSKPITRFCIGRTDAADNDRVLQIVKTDGKIIEFRNPILVKDVLVNFPGLNIATSTKLSDHLPVDHQLQIGKVYYFLPPNSTVNSSAQETEHAGGGKRIKLVITKQQLQDLLSKQISVGEILAGKGKGNVKSQTVEFSRICKPKLEPITE